MGITLGRGPGPHSFWDLPDAEMDFSDLACVVAGDLSEGLINPLVYLPFQNDYIKIAQLRVALSFAADDPSLADMTVEQLQAFNAEKLTKFMLEFGFEPVEDKHQQLLALHQWFYPFCAYGMEDSLTIEHSSVANYPDNLDDLREVIMEHFNITYLKPFACQRLVPLDYYINPI